MTDQPFSNRELEAKFEAIHADIKSILSQTTKTNGRVTNLEVKANGFDNWKNFIQGGLAVLTLMVVPIFIYLVTHWK